MLHAHGWNSHQLLLVKGADWTGAESWDEADWTKETNESMDEKLRNGTARAFRMWTVGDNRDDPCAECGADILEDDEAHEDEQTLETFCGECWVKHCVAVAAAAGK